MKLTANFFQGKKPSLEEGPMIYTVSNDSSETNGTRRSRGCKLFLQFMKVIFYVLLLLFILFIVWILFVFATYALSSGQEPAMMCGVRDDSFDPDGFVGSGNGYNPMEVNDMVENIPGSVKVVNYNVKEDDFMDFLTTTIISDVSTTDENIFSYEEKR